MQVTTKAQTWDYINNVVLKNLYPDKWYDIDERWNQDENVYSFPSQLYLDDGVSKIVTGARLRQLRVKPGMVTSHGFLWIAI